MTRQLLIVYHSKGGTTGKMAQVVAKGAGHPDVQCDINLLLAKEAGLQDLLQADGLIAGTPENFGYMSGVIKDFFDRTFYLAQGKVAGLPYSIFISAGNDGSGALTSIRRICTGYPFKEVQAPVISQGGLSEEKLLACKMLGMSMAAGIESGIF